MLIYQACLNEKLKTYIYLIRLSLVKKYYEYGSVLFFSIYDCSLFEKYQFCTVSKLLAKLIIHFCIVRM